MGHPRVTHGSHTGQRGGAPQQGGDVARHPPAAAGGARRDVQRGEQRGRRHAAEEGVRHGDAVADQPREAERELPCSGPWTKGGGRGAILQDEWGCGGPDPPPTVVAGFSVRRAAGARKSHVWFASF